MLREGVAFGDPGDRRQQCGHGRRDRRDDADPSVTDRGEEAHVGDAGRETADGAEAQVVDREIARAEQEGDRDERHKCGEEHYEARFQRVARATVDTAEEVRDPDEEGSEKGEDDGHERPQTMARAMAMAANARAPPPPPQGPVRPEPELRREALCTECPALRRLDLTVLRGRRGDQFAQEPAEISATSSTARSNACGVCLGGFGEATDLPHVLQRRATHLVLGCGWLEVVESPDVSAHGGKVSHFARRVPLLLD